MARIEEGTLFKPDPKMQYPGGRSGGVPQPSGGPGGGGGGGDEEEGPSIAVRDRIFEAMRSAKRRMGLAFFVMMIGAALTVLAAIFAPKSYEVESQVLVQRVAQLTGQQAQYISPEELSNIRNEYQQQALARDSIIAIVKDKDLVDRWDAMRQPYRRLLDRINQRLGKSPPADDAKFDALVASIQQKMKVWVDATTVTVRLEWSEPEAARDIVDAAVKNFLKARYESEVGVIPTRLKIQESFVLQAHKDLEAAAADLDYWTRRADPNNRAKVFIPQLPQNVREADVDPALKAKLENVRQQIAQLQGTKQNRIAELNQQLREKQQQLGPNHPDIVSLKRMIAESGQDDPQLATLKAQEREILNTIENQKKTEVVRPAPRPNQAVAPTPVVPPAPENSAAPKNLQDATVRFETAKTKYATLVQQMSDIQLDLQTTEAAYKNRYKITQPAEVPIAPKRPVMLIASIIGLLATIAAMLIVAGIADRLSGIFFEPRDVRDRLGLPVFATFS
ncbi:MAG: hypothetical protein FWD73_07850 [Polyangiaceae bacterium]|nr:hypothetical protein [Polyangiaceae bacterium]